MNDQRTIPLKVLFVVPMLAVGGAEKHLATVLPKLRETGFDIRVVTARGEAVLDAVLRETGVPVINTPMVRPSPLRRLAACRTIWRQIRDWRPDVVHFFLPEAYILGGLTAWLARHPVRVMSRRSLNTYQKDRRVVIALEHFLHRRMAAVTGNSEAVRTELLAEGVPPGRLHVIRNGIAEAAFRPSAKADARARLDIPEDAFVMTCFANLIPYKGHADLIDALISVKDRIPANWLLLLAGRDDGIGEDLRRRAEAGGIGGNIRLLGFRDDLAEITGASDLGLLVSHEEGSPNSVLESMAAGLPMVVTDAGGTAEAAIDGQTALVVPAHDSAAIAEAIVALANDPDRRERFGDAAKARARDTFSLEACTNAYAQLYEGLVSAEQQQ